MKSGNQNEFSLLDRLASYTGLKDSDGHPIHNLHPYPAKYIPKLPREVIAEHVNERHTILDPFCGSGTSLVEAAIQGVRSIGIDSNPVAAMISRAKTRTLSSKELALADDLLSRVSETSTSRLPRRYSVPDAPRLSHWFQPNVQRELSWVFSSVNAVSEPGLRDFLRSVASSIVTSVSNQDSETRYTAVDKSIEDGYVLKRFERKLAKSLRAAEEWRALEINVNRTPNIINRPVGDVGKEFLADDSVDLIVTSPPYPNSFDYYLYHKLRMIWLGFDYIGAQADEIGSRYEHSSKKAPIDKFVERMRPVMLELSRVLKPSKLAYLFVGDSVLNGAVVNMTELYADLAREAGFRFIDERAYGLNLVSRSFKDTRDSAGTSKKQKMQRIILLESTKSAAGRKGSRSAAAPSAKTLPIELSQTPLSGSVIAIRSDDSDRHVHSLIPYPSKFIPEIPRWAINEFSRPGDTVLDPFAGSGTTAVEAIVAGRNAVSVDVSPWASLVSRAKTTIASPQELRKSADSLVKKLRGSDFIRRSPERFELDDFWFNLDHLAEFSAIHNLINATVATELRDFFSVCLASTIRAFSYQDPAQIKVKRDPKKVAAGTPSPLEVFVKRMPAHVERLIRFNELADVTASHLTVTSSVGEWAAKSDARQYDLLVTSPPYINAMNYAMSSRYELLLLGLIQGHALNEHQQSYYGTERVYARDYKQLHSVGGDWSSAGEINEILERIYLSEPKRSFIVYDFFIKMRAAFEAMLKTLRPGARVVIVTGTNTIRQVPVDTHRLLMECLQDLGCELTNEFHYEILRQRLKITRHSTASLIPHDGVAVLTWKG